MFDRDEGRRISVADIKAHPWTRGPVPERYRQALEELGEAQKGRDAVVRGGGCQVGGRGLSGGGGGTPWATGRHCPGL